MSKLYLIANSTTGSTARQEYWQNLSYIAEITGELNRRMTFKQAEDWCNDYQYYLDEGFPADYAEDRAYDHYWSVRIGARGFGQ